MFRRSILFALGLVACGTDKGDDTETGEPTGGPGTTGSTTDTADTADSTGTTGTDTTGTDTTTGTSTGEPTTGVGTTGDPDDFEALAACAVPMVCDEFIHDAGEVMGHGDGPEGFLDVERCILTGLRDGTPGRYTYGVHTYVANGDADERAHIIVHADGKVTFAEHRTSNLSNGASGSTVTEVFTAAQTCTIADATFFDDCFANHDDWTHYTECMQIEKWWTGCAEMGPRCE